MPLLEEIGARHVFSHGDFNFSNILISISGAPTFLDLEFCFSAPPLYDIGKFFRTRDSIRDYLTADVIDAFSEGYNSKASFPLPGDWYRMARLADVGAMLNMISRPSIPAGWGEEIGEEIDLTLDLYA